MKVENKKMKAMEALFRKIRKGGLSPEEIKQLKKISAYFLFVAVAEDYTK